MVLRHTTKDETESPLKKANVQISRSMIQRGAKEDSQITLKKRIASPQDNSRKKGHGKRKNISFQTHGGKKVKYPVEDVSLEMKNGSDINVDKDDTSLPLPKPSSNAKITRKRDRVLKRKERRGRQMATNLDSPSQPSIPIKLHQQTVMMRAAYPKILQQMKDLLQKQGIYQV